MSTAFNIAPCNGLQGAVVQYAANQPGTLENPFSLREVHQVLHVHTQHTGSRALYTIQRTYNNDRVSCIMTQASCLSVLNGTRTHTLLNRNARAYKVLNPS